MSNFELIRDDIAKRRIEIAFGNTKKLLRSLPNKRASRKFLDSILFLEYQYNNLSKGSDQMLGPEQAVVMRNRVIYGFFAILTEIELLNNTLTPSVRKLKKIQLVTEINLNGSCKQLSALQSRKINIKDNTRNITEDYLLEKIEKLENIHKTILKASKYFSIPFSLYFILQMVQLYMKWEHSHAGSHTDGYNDDASLGDDFFLEGALFHSLILGDSDDGFDHGALDGYHSSAMDDSSDDTDSSADGGDD